VGTRSRSASHSAMRNVSGGEESHVSSVGMNTNGRTTPTAANELPQLPAMPFVTDEVWDIKPGDASGRMTPTAANNGSPTGSGGEVSAIPHFVLSVSKERVR
jgi:hypothetical protein